MEWGTKALIRVGDNVEELRELVCVFTSASCRELVMGDMIYVLALLAVAVKKSLSPPSRASDRVRMSSSPLINENDRMVDSAVCVWPWAYRTRYVA